MNTKAVFALEALIKTEAKYSLKLAEKFANDDGTPNAFYVGKACAYRRLLGYIELLKGADI